MIVDELNAKRHFELSMSETEFTTAKAHLRLASLYDDFDQLTSDVTELQFLLKWIRPKEAAAVLDRVIKSQQSDSVWKLVHEIFQKALTFSECAERNMFTHVTSELFDIIVSGLTKRFDSDDSLKVKLLLFGVEVLGEDKQNKIINRALTFFTERANIDKDLRNGVGIYHVILGALVAKFLNSRNLLQTPPNRLCNVIVIALNVAVMWTYISDTWIEILINISPVYSTDVSKFKDDRWLILSKLIERYIHGFDTNVTLNLQTSLCAVGDCEGFAKFVEKFSTLKIDSKKVALLYFICVAYCAWIDASKGCFLVWIPANDWSSEVQNDVSHETDAMDKLQQRSRSRTKDRREICSKLKSSNKTLCEAFELGSYAYHTFCNSLQAGLEDFTRIAKNVPDLQRFISESLLFECRADEASNHLNERLATSTTHQGSSWVLYYHLLCANCLQKNWLDAMKNFIRALTMVDPMKLSPQKVDPGTKSEDCESNFQMMNEEESASVLFDVAHHVLYKACASSSNGNDRILGSLIVLSQIEFAYKGHRCFNRVLRHIEEKHSFICTGLLEYVTNLAIIEEFARVQLYCDEHVTMQIGTPRVTSVIMTPLSVAEKASRLQALECQMKRWRENPVDIVKSYFVNNEEVILNALETSMEL